MSKLADRISFLTESQTIAMARKGRELQAKGIDVINLSLGEPDFNTPDFIKEAAKQAIDANYSHYSPVPGYLDLREAIAKKLEKYNELKYTHKQIVVSTGAKQAVANVILSLLNPGEEILLLIPYWVSYLEIVKLTEGKPVFIPTSVESNYKITPSQLEKAITPKTKLLIINSPCNPSGTVYSKEELKEFAKIIAKYKDLYIISDEIYEKINFTGQQESIAQFDFIKDRVIVINGVSKGFAMTGWRVGYLAAPEWLAKACTKIQGQFTSGTCSIAQQAAKAAISAEPSATAEMRGAFLTRRDLVLKLLTQIPGLKMNEPEGAFYVFPDISSYFGKSDGDTKINNATDLCMYLLTNAHVGIVTGEAFGSPDCVRISYAASEDKLNEAINRIKIALSHLE